MFAGLNALVRGLVATSTDPDWDTVHAAWNLHVDQRPAAVVEATDVDEPRAEAQRA